MSFESVGLVWFRRDLRLDDNPAWAAATARCATVVPLFVLEPRLLDQAGPFRRRQVLATVRALDDEVLERFGEHLLLRTGDPVDLVPSAVEHSAATHVFWNADVTPYATRRDAAVTERLDVPVTTFFGTLVHPPGRVLTAKGTLSRVFTPFYRTWGATDPEPWPEAGEATVPATTGDALPDVDGPACFPGGERGAWGRLETFLDKVDRYDVERDRLDLDATSSLSTDLSLGTISPRAIVDAVGQATPGRSAFVRQLAWRDWYAHLLADDPSLRDHAATPRFDLIEWRSDPAGLSAWKDGRTGVPVVDAGMRQLAATGTVHNRVRMICGSFLVKNLLIDWRVGEAHYRHLLVDADVAQNVGNWQWVAGSGLDASPYHRIFNPVTQSRKFDPAGAYIRRWVPEISQLDDAALHAPWEAAPLDLAAAEVVLGDTYPWPVVDLSESRKRALDAYDEATERALVEAPE